MIEVMKVEITIPVEILERVVDHCVYTGMQFSTPFMLALVEHLGIFDESDNIEERTMELLDRVSNNLRRN